MRLISFEELVMVSGGADETPPVDGGSSVKGEGGKAANCPVGTTPIVIKATGGIELGLPGGFNLKTSGGIEFETCWPLKNSGDKEASPTGSTSKPKPSTPPQPSP